MRKIQLPELIQNLIVQISRKKLLEFGHTQSFYDLLKNKIKFVSYKGVCGGLVHHVHLEVLNGKGVTPSSFSWASPLGRRGEGEKGSQQEARVRAGIGNQGDVGVVGSLNCMEWSLLPPATEEMMTQTSVVKGRFMGDPSHEYEHTELQKVKEGDKVFEEEVVVSEGERRRN